MTMLEVLRAIRARIERPDQWTKEAWARTVSGEVLVNYLKPQAVCWCLGGAILAESIGVDRPSAPQIAAALGFPEEKEGDEDLNGLDSLISWNDQPHRIHAEVIGRLDTAITRLETK